MCVSALSDFPRIYLGGGAEPQYRPDPTGLGVVEYLVAATGGRLFNERAVLAAGRPARRFPGRGLAVARRQQKSTIALAPYVAITALAPLALLLWGRTCSGGEWGCL